VASLPALGPWAPPAERGLSLESIYRVSLTVGLCEGNKIISYKKNLFHHSQLGGPQKRKKIRGLLWVRAQCAHWLKRPCLYRVSKNDDIFIFWINHSKMNRFQWFLECRIPMTFYMNNTSLSSTPEKCHRTTLWNADFFIWSKYDLHYRTKSVDSTVTSVTRNKSLSLLKIKICHSP